MRIWSAVCPHVTLGVVRWLGWDKTNGDINAMKILVAVLLVLAASGLTDVSHAEVKRFQYVGEEDRLQIREIIGAQLQAFHSKDAEKAFSYASPYIQNKFRTPTRFFSMVRKFWPEVYNARRSEFLQLAEVKGILIQGVIISDDLGETWLAQYPMELQPDGNWLINGCVVRALEDRSL